MTIRAVSGYVPSYVPKAQRQPRANELYAKTKIESFIRYCRAAERVFAGQKAQGKIRKIVHFEPFCGPGVNRNRDGVVFEGTALRSVKELAAYDFFVFNDIESSVMDCLYSFFVDLGMLESLEKEIILSVMDANEFVANIDAVLPRRIDRTCPFMGTTIVDPNGLHFRWTSTALLARKRLDLLEMVPTHIDLVRNLNHPDSQDYILGWLGEAPISKDWVEVLTQYESKLKLLYRHVLGISTNPLPEREYIWVKNRYHLIAASNCPNNVANNIWTGEVTRQVRGNKGIPLFPEFEC